MNMKLLDQLAAIGCLGKCRRLSAARKLAVTIVTARQFGALLRCAAEGNFDANFGIMSVLLCHTNEIRLIQQRLSESAEAEICDLLIMAIEEQEQDLKLQVAGIVLYWMHVEKLVRRNWRRLVAAIEQNFPGMFPRALAKIADLYARP